MTSFQWWCRLCSFALGKTGNAVRKAITLDEFASPNAIFWLG